MEEFSQIYDIKSRHIKTECLHQEWQTSGSVRVVRLAFNPSLGMITINAFACAYSILIPVQAAYLPAKGLKQLM
ncbi:MAG: AAA family ATPase [Lachnospiraceae bacterium]|jgi:ATPases involved in chromosome partitioning